MGQEAKKVFFFPNCNKTCFILIEILTILEDEVVNDEKWELKLFHIWTVPQGGKVKYNFLLFQKGGIVYKSSVNCIFSKCGDSDLIYLKKVKAVHSLLTSFFIE